MFKKHHKPIDHLLLALAALSEGDSKTATQQLAEAIADPDALDDALEDLNDSNEVALDLDMDDDDMDMDDNDEEADYDGDDTEDDFPERTNSVASIMKRAKAQASSDDWPDDLDELVECLNDNKETLADVKTHLKRAKTKGDKARYSEWVEELESDIAELQAKIKLLEGGATRVKVGSSSDGLDDEDADLEPDDDDMGGESDEDEDDMDTDDEEEDSDFDDIMDDEDESTSGKMRSSGKGPAKPKPTPHPGANSRKHPGASHSSLAKVTASVVARNKLNRKGLL